jgi:hypothetical protein
MAQNFEKRVLQKCLRLTFYTYNPYHFLNKHHSRLTLVYMFPVKVSVPENTRWALSLLNSGTEPPASGQPGVVGTPPPPHSLHHLFFIVPRWWIVGQENVITKTMQRDWTVWVWYLCRLPERLAELESGVVRVRDTRFLCKNIIIS